MSILTFLQSPEWDAPFFKRLAHNDTGGAIGHQAGMVLPKDLRRFLPVLDENRTNPNEPTVDRHLLVEMFVGTIHLANGVVRYQFQTWGGTRSPESRITDGFQPLRNRAEEGDILIMQRRAMLLNRFRLVLIKRNAPEFAVIEEYTEGRRWGPLSTNVMPVTQSDLIVASSEITDAIRQPFQLLRTTVPRAETRQGRIARSSVFSERVRREYSRRCAVSGIVIATPTELYEAESAHVVPLSEGGTDDIRNGFALSQTLHWAFDKGLFGISHTRRIYIPRRVSAMTVNSYLNQFAGCEINEASTPALRVHPDAFRWHFEKMVTQWD
ncbi:restriction endonuclease [Oleiharenicola lentus]|uniref:Restriction endonuclease n=1 Tax=Oleiharenicola lentus TaxID=2508720 RepID=A0A4Q1C8L3_9BACT|nr:HNH endonuclease [Oleiharenicola lentus]RXK55293.1 restriction endonuclease [Oleiharenicola lentus]